MNHIANDVGEELSMKKIRFLSAMLALAMVFGLAFVSCDNGLGDNSQYPFEGTWSRQEGTRKLSINFRESYYTMSDSQSPGRYVETGTFTYTSTRIQFMPDQLNYSRTQDYVLTKSYLDLEYGISAGDFRGRFFKER